MSPQSSGHRVGKGISESAMEYLSIRSRRLGKIVSGGGENLVRELELGGKSPVIFTADGIDERSIAPSLA